MDLGLGELGRNLTISSLIVMERYSELEVLDLRVFET